MSDQDHWHAHRICEALTRQGVGLPSATTLALSTLDHIEARKPATEADRQPLIDAYLAKAKASEINTAATEFEITTVRFQCWSQARNQAGRRVLAALRDNHEDIVTALAERAAPLIADIEHAANVETTMSLDKLVRDGRDDDAKVVARLEIVAAELDSIYQLRHDVTPREGRYSTAAFDCGVWRDPRAAQEVKAKGTADYYTAGIRAGGRLWMPTWRQALAAAEEIANEQSSAALRQAEHQEVRTRRQGRTVFA
jgi:hypothetical protein